MPELAGDGDRMDGSPLPGSGVSQERLDELNGILAQLQGQIRRMNASIMTHDQSINELASWAQVAAQALNLVSSIGGQLIARHQSQQGQAVGPSKQNQLLQGVLGLATTPAAGQPAAAMALIQSLLKP